MAGTWSRPFSVRGPSVTVIIHTLDPTLCVKGFQFSVLRTAALCPCLRYEKPNLRGYLNPVS